MRPLPRVHAVTDARIRRLDDFGVRAAAIAAAGPAVAIHARDRTASADDLARLTARIRALAAPPMAQVAVNGRCDIAAAYEAQGVQLGMADLAPTDARRVAPGCWIGCSVHSEDEARAAADGGADLLLVGTIFATASHPGREPAGLALIEATAKLGLPVVAIGGMTPARAAEACNAGAWGVAMITALWDAPDPAAAVTETLAALATQQH